MDVKEVLCKAVDEINTRGWFQGWLVNTETGAVCLVGAINCAIYGEPQNYDGYNAEKSELREESYDRVTKAIQEVSAVPEFSIAEWNDEEGRTKEEVIHLLQSAGSCDEEIVSATGEPMPGRGEPNYLQPDDPSLEDSMYDHANPTNW